jgi:hypothetical protein
MACILYNEFTVFGACSLVALLEYAQTAAECVLWLYLSVSPTFYNFLHSFGFCTVDLFLDLLKTLLFPVYVGRVCFICAEPCILFQSIFDKEITRNRSSKFVPVYIFTLLGLTLRLPN